MKYNIWYDNIIEKAKTRFLTDYTETHHIVPRSLGGTDEKENLVELTAREHFVCHWLLTKMHTGEARGKMINAMYMMRAEGPYQKRYKSKITSRVYEKLRVEYRDYISNLNKGRVQPPEEKERQLKAQLGRKRAPFSDEWRAKLSAAKKGENNNRYGVKISEETRRKMSEKAKGRKYSAETIEKRAAKIRGSKRDKLTCPHCCKDIAVNGYARWHGDNCKSKKE